MRCLDRELRRCGTDRGSPASRGRVSQPHRPGFRNAL